MSKKMPKVGEFCWNELMTPDVKKSKEFYNKLFGWEYEDHDMGKMIYSMIKSEVEGCGGGILPTPDELKKTVPPHWLSYVYVEKVDESVKTAESLGAKIMVPPTDISDYGRFAVIQDPVGAHIAIWQSLKTCD